MVVKDRLMKEYPVNKHNSTVLGYPGRDFDWSKFCWDGSAVYVDEIGRGITSERHAPLPFKDNGLIEEGNEYLHVPYNWEDDSTIYRVRPNDSMRAGRVYRGHKVMYCRAVEHDGKWYWQLEFEDFEKAVTA